MERPGGGAAEKAIVLFSGGQDSTTCLAWALDRFAGVETVGSDCGQRNSIELACRKTVLAEMRQGFAPWALRLGEDHNVDLSARGRLSETALTREVAIALGENGLPTTFVPGRNLLAERLGGMALVDLIREHTHSCYLDERGRRWAWGYGCGGCPVCTLRAIGYERCRAPLRR